MPSPREKFQDLLKKLFQFGSAELDFGIYRIMNHKRDVIQRFIEKDLLDGVAKELESGALAEDAEQAKQLEELQKKIREDYGDDALDAEGNLLKGAELRLGKDYLKLRESAATSKATPEHEAEIFNHLYAFFSRYYDEGDFMSLRRYSKREKYAIPYNGEEVYLHWANADQHYIKTGENFTDYSYKHGGWTVQFKLRNAEVEQNNVKGAKRFFIPRVSDILIEEKSSTLTIPFEFRPLNASEEITYGKGNGDREEEGTKGKKKKGQEGILVESIVSIRGPQPETGDERPPNDQKQTPTTRIEKRQIIDGQQRLTTLQIFLAALRDFARAQGCAGPAADLDELTRNRGRVADPTEYYKVWPTQRDRDQFRDVMDLGSKHAIDQKHPLRKLPRRRKYESRPRMVEAYMFFYRQLLEFFVEGGVEEPIGKERGLESRIDDALNALRGALQVVVIDLGQDDDAQVIFETLNARGEPLLPADLLRNYIFLRAARRGESQEALYEEYWKPFDDSFWRERVRQGRLIRPRSDLFMQHYLSSRQFNDVPVTHLFVEYKYWINKKNPFSSVADELSALATARENYKKFLSSPATTPLGAFARFLDSFDVGTIHPLMMVIAEAKPSEDELESMLQMLESYIVRRTVCGLPTKAYNRVFLGLASGISQDGVKAVTLRDRLSTLSGESSVWPKDEDFAAAFLTRAGYYSLSQPRVLHILKRLNESFYSSRSEKVTIQSDLWVEHLMPQKWQEHWPLADGNKGLTAVDRVLLDATSPGYAESADRDRLVQSIGNLTLLTHQLNISISNGPWEIKRAKIAEHSVLPLNQMAASRDVWDEASIKTRAQDLLARALTIWPGPTPQKKPA